jgi:conjugal transfer pilin signal peptidase TrbI
MRYERQVQDWDGAFQERAAVRPGLRFGLHGSRAVRWARCLATRVAQRSFGRLRQSVLRRFSDRWPVIRRTLPRDLVLLLWAALLLQHFSFGWVATDSVNTNVVLIHKAVAPKTGELAVFGYAGGQIPEYYPDSFWVQIRQALGMDASREGPRKGDGFVKYLLGVPGDRIEVTGKDVVLHTARGSWNVGRCKAESRHGHPLTCITSRVIPPGFVYVWAPHADALDSRYEVMGLVPAASIAGKAVRLW